MEITEVRVFLKEGQDKKLKAYATVTFENKFVVRNIKVIQGSDHLFIAMPSRKMKYACRRCHYRNESGSRYCGGCGAAIDNRFDKEPESSDAKTEHRDIAHPITQQFRDYLQTEILKAYAKDAQTRPGSQERSASRPD